MADSNGRKLPRYWPFSLVVLVAVTVTLGWHLYRPAFRFHGPLAPSYEPLPRSFDGESGALAQTVIVPTLDTPIPQGKSALWCLSFQLAWNRAKTDLAKGPIKLANAESVAERLNRATTSEADLDQAEYYAAAGLVRDKIADKIGREMAKRFPSAPLPRLVEEGDAAIAFAYLQAGITYRFPYFDNPEDLVFKDSTGRTASVRSFGIGWRGTGIDTVRGQAEVLFGGVEMRDADFPVFALDLCRFSQPNQLVLAIVKRQHTLAEALAEVQAQRARFQPKDSNDRSMGRTDMLLVPDIHWRISHHFRELEGTDKLLLNPALARLNLYLASAEQMIDFRMDRSGAAVKSEARIGMKLAPRVFWFDRPFLVSLSKRGATQPFFVLWVDNAELLQRR